MIVKSPITKPPVVGINKGRTQRERLARCHFTTIRKAQSAFVRGGAKRRLLRTIIAGNQRSDTRSWVIAGDTGLVTKPNAQAFPPSGNCG